LSSARTASIPETSIAMPAEPLVLLDVDNVEEGAVAADDGGDLVVKGDS
jgi:hypothetical protein